MKKLIYSLALAAVALGFGGCKETWDENPVLKGHEGTLTAEFLNEPVMKDYPLMINDANKTGSMLLTCSQPDYGYAAVATYKVQVSLTEDFEQYQEISQAFYDCAQIKPVNGDIAAAIEKLAGVRSEEDLPLPYQPMYVRLRAYIEQSPENTEYISNVVSFDKVAADYLAIWVSEVPVNMYVRGSFNPNWDALEDYQLMTGPEEDTWVSRKVITLEKDTQFKVADSSWSDACNWGANSSSATVKIGENYTLKISDNPGNLNVDEDFTGTVLVRKEKGNYILLLDPKTEEE
ncbi:MAG: SusE domain-containing protein [Muribaculaceae bacterium]|nr:SusE domain-containing protein [Muribaculaceae bacterium]